MSQTGSVFTVRSFARTLSHTTTIFAEDLGETHSGALTLVSVSVSPNETWLFDSVDHILVVSLTLPGFYNTFSPTSTGFLQL